MADPTNQRFIDRLREIASQLNSLASDMEAESPRPSPAVKRRVTDFAKAGKCLHCGKPFNNSPSKRGLHPNCYAMLMQRISRGHVTEFELIQEGRMAPRGRGGRRLNQLPPLPPIAEEDG